MIGLVTSDAAAPLDPDLGPFAESCRRLLGDDAVRIVSWDADVDWAAFDAVVIRSTWDYPERIDDFLAWVDRVGAATRLVNGPGAVHWSADKHYLAALEREGIAVVPTIFVRPGEAAPAVEGLHVVKPTVGAGSSGARRCRPDEVADHVALLHAAGFTAMVQPYLVRLDEHGETAHCFVPGVDGGLEYSHAFRKAAILTSTEVEQEGDLFAKEEIDGTEPTAAERAVAEAVVASAAIRSLDEICFARVDVAPFRDRDGIDSHVVMEVELIEPSFYFDTAPGTCDRFATRLVARLRSDDAAAPAGDR